MLRASLVQHETWRALYHRQRLPRAMALQRYIRIQEKRYIQRQQIQQRQQQAADGSAMAAAASSSAFESTHVTAAGPTLFQGPGKDNNLRATSVQPAEVNHKYNRFFVNDDWEFVAQQAFTEDPAVSAKRRATLPEPTKAELWKTARSPAFQPFAPMSKVVDYAKDPDFKLLKPTNLPRHKDFMVRFKPSIPRTWY
jgi:hypothetical protein